MSYLLGNKVCMESLAADVQDLQLTISEVLSRVGPMHVQSWKFPDKNACDLDIDDLLDLYDYGDDANDPEAKQISHIALYELVIDRLIFMVQAVSKFSSLQVNYGHMMTPQDTNIDQKGAGSVGLIIKQYWTQVVKFQAQHLQLLSESKRINMKLKDIEMEVSKSPMEDIQTNSSSTALLTNRSRSVSSMDMSGTLELPPHNNSERFLMEKSPVFSQNSAVSISRDSNNKSCQTYESAFVPCDSCDLIQRKLREAGEVVIKVCTEQGLPCSLKKFRTEVSHVDMLSFSDISRWMVEQNKDIARIGKQNTILEASINPLKADMKMLEKKSEEAEVKAQTIERNMKEEVNVREHLCKNYENKLQDQEKHFKELNEEEKRQKCELKKSKEKLEKEVTEVRHELEKHKEVLTELEINYKKLEIDLEEKKNEVEHAHELGKEVADLKSKLADVTSALDGHSKTLAREQAISRSASRHNESLQAKQDTLLTRMDTLGKENEDLSQQVASLEEEKTMLEDTLNKLEEETKSMVKTAKENEVIIEKLEIEKTNLEKYVQDAERFIKNFELELNEAKERERMIVEYPDLNGPVNADLQGTGDVAVDMQNQIAANTIRIRILEEQNQTLLQSTQRLAALRSAPGIKLPSAYTPVRLVPLWQPNSSVSGNQRNNNSNYQQNGDAKVHEHRMFSSDKMSPPQQYMGNSDNLDYSKHKQYLWTHAKKETELLKGIPGSDVSPQEFLIGHGSTSQNLKQKEDRASRQGRPSSAKLSSVMVPVNATPIIAYTHMKKALGIISGKDNNTKGRPPSGRQYASKMASMTPGDDLRNEHGSRNDGSTTAFSCPHCDKMYLKSRDLDIHLTYCST